MLLNEDGNLFYTKVNQTSHLSDSGTKSLRTGMFLISIKMLEAKLTIRISKSKLKTLAFNSIYASFLTYSFLGHVPSLALVLEAYRYISLIALFVMACIQIRKCYKRDAWIALIICLIALLTNMPSLYKLVMISMIAQGKSIYNTIKFEAKMRFVLIILLALLCQGGLAPDAQSWYAGDLRHSMGFKNANHHGMALAILCIEILYLFHMKFNLFGAASTALILVYESMTSKSRTSEIIILFVLFLMLLNTLIPTFINSKPIRSLLILAPILFALLTSVFVFLYIGNLNIAAVVDKLLSGRIRLAATYFQVAPISLFGIIARRQTVLLDNAYAFLWIATGIVGFSLYIILLTRTIKNAIHKQDIPLALVFCCFSLYGLSERLWLAVDYNAFVLALVWDMFGFRVHQSKESLRKNEDKPASNRIKSF